MDLSGTWRAAVAEPALLRTFPDYDFDDEAWSEIDVPGHWQSTPAFAGSDGPILYRTRFESDVPEDGRRSWLVLDGLFYHGDIWFDGTYLGATEGYFAPHSFELTPQLRSRREHCLALEVACSREEDLAAKRNITGVFGHWDCFDPDANPGGIWRQVRLEESGPVRLRDRRVICTEAADSQALLTFWAVLDSVQAQPVIVRSTIGAVDHRLEHDLAAGENHIEWTVTVPSPRLWWPHALGDQPMYDVAIEVTTAESRLSDRCTLRTGLRSVDLRNWVLHVNGERMFLKGANQGPARMRLAEASAAEMAADLALAKDAGLDLLRVHAHISKPDLYDEADSMGLLLWQDFPLQWGYARSIRKQAIRQARQAVNLLGHHPSIAMWCAHNEPMAISIDPSQMADRKARAALAVKAALSQELPTFNKTVLDASLKRAFKKTDGSRPVIAHSGVFPHPPQLDGTDTHVYFGWYHGEERDFPRFCAAVPRLARFVSEFGAQAVPTNAEFCEPERWPDLDWEHLGHTHSLQKVFFDRHVPPGDYPTFEAWQAATQRYQAEVIRYHIETLRRLKYRPTGGFAQFCFADGHPAVTWSVLGHDRVPKLGYEALENACRPVIVVADRLPPAVTPGEALAVDVHVVSDRRSPIAGAITSAHLTWEGGEHAWCWQGDVPADECVRVGTIQAMVPAAPGPLTLDLELTFETSRLTSRYETVIR